MGPDGINPRILKCWLMSPLGLSMIFEQSWESGNVSVDWKLASVVPIFKDDPGNYRPVSLFLLTDKIVEKIILGLFIAS